MPAHFIPLPLQSFFSFSRLSAKPRNFGTPAHLNDYMLRDIGLSRQQVGPERHKW